MSTPLRYGMIAIATSTGGVQALRTLLSSLPRDLPVPVTVVLHRTRRAPDLLPELLSRWSSLPVHAVRPGQVIQPAHIYVAPASAHLVVSPSRRLELIDGRRIRHVLSSANPLFSSAAEVLGPVIGVVLTGMGADATDGVQAVKQAGGVVIAQDETSSVSFSMPSAAIATGAVDFVLPLDRIGAKLLELVAPAGDLTPTRAEEVSP